MWLKTDESNLKSLFEIFCASVLGTFIIEYTVYIFNLCLYFNYSKF